VIIQASGLAKAYGSTTVLSGLELIVEAGTVHALLGPNGAGKTTTVRILATLLRPDAGQARVAGHDVVRDPMAVRRMIGLTGQYAALDELQTARENLVMMGQLARLGRRPARRRADELLDRLGLADVGDRRVKTLSGGMRRRIDLAAGLVARPQVIFLDEPTTGLDPASRLAMWDLVRELVADGATVLLTTQYLEEADQLADRITVIDNGRIAAEGTPAQLKRTVGDERAELAFADAATAIRAAAMLAVSADRDTVSVPTDGSASAVRDLLGGLATHGIEPLTIALTKPSLDDVFLALTGSAHRTEETAA
jgi:ABC-2 type transport system ATP-binding protein